MLVKNKRTAGLAVETDHTQLTISNRKSQCFLGCSSLIMTS